VILKIRVRREDPIDCRTCGLPLAMHPQLGGNSVCIILPARTDVKVTP
jgi:hypothetical protein